MKPALYSTAERAQASIDAELLVPAEVRRIRKKLGFKSERSGGDLWSCIRAFSRYERGETRQGKALDKLLRCACLVDPLVKTIIHRV